MKFILKIGIIILIIAAGAWLLRGYFSKGPVMTDPKELVLTYLKYLGEGDYNSAVKLMASEVKKDTNQDKFIKAKDKLVALYGPNAFSKIDVSIASSTDSQAKALVKLNGMNREDLTFNLVKEGEGWKIGK